MVACFVLLLSRSQSQFYEDEDLEERFRNRLEDFQKSGYDRGHLVRRGLDLLSDNVLALTQ